MQTPKLDLKETRPVLADDQAAQPPAKALSDGQSVRPLDVTGPFVTAGKQARAWEAVLPPHTGLLQQEEAIEHHLSASPQITAEPV